MALPLKKHQHLQQHQADTYITYHQDELNALHAARQKPIMERIMDPFRRAGQRIMEVRGT